jgi:DNA-binding response OmpR family regulator
MKSSPPSKILMIGNDMALTYLVGRYADRSGYTIATLQTVPSAEEVCKQQPVALLFPSIERLGAAQSLIAELSQCDIPILVCSSIADEARARELGADYCLLHPLTYDAFLAALAATKAPDVKRH